MKLVYFMPSGAIAVPTSWDADGRIRVVGARGCSAILNPAYHPVYKVPAAVFEAWLQSTHATIESSRVRGGTIQGLAAWQVQRAWRRAISCPEFAVCRRRLMREAAEMANPLYGGWL